MNFVTVNITDLHCAKLCWINTSEILVTEVICSTKRDEEQFGYVRHYQQVEGKKEESVSNYLVHNNDTGNKKAESDLRQKYPLGAGDLLGGRI